MSCCWWCSDSSGTTKCEITTLQILRKFSLALGLTANKKVHKHIFALKERGKVIK